MENNVDKTFDQIFGNKGEQVIDKIFTNLKRFEKEYEENSKQS